MTLQQAENVCCSIFDVMGAAGFRGYGADMPSVARNPSGLKTVSV